MKCACVKVTFLDGQSLRQLEFHFSVVLLADRAGKAPDEPTREGSPLRPPEARVTNRPAIEAKDDQL